MSLIAKQKYTADNNYFFIIILYIYFNHLLN